MIRVDPMYKTLHFINFTIICTDQLIRLKERGIASVKKLNRKIYINKPFRVIKSCNTERRKIDNEKHINYLIKIRNHIIKEIKEIQKEIKKRNDAI